MRVSDYEQVRRWVAAGASTVPALQQRTGLPETRVVALLRELCDDGKVQVVGDGRYTPQFPGYW